MISEQSSEPRVYVIYDGRACDGDTSEASVILSGLSEKEATRKRYGPNAGEYGTVACFSYRKDCQELIDERHEWNCLT